MTDLKNKFCLIFQLYATFDLFHLCSRAVEKKSKNNNFVKMYGTEI